MAIKPYVGVTGFTAPDEVRHAREHIPPSSFPPMPSRCLMVGVLASYKSVRSLPMKERWAQQTPALKAVSDIFLRYPDTLRLVHYSGDETMLADLLDIVARLDSSAADRFHGFQLNIAWPKPLALETFHRRTLAAPKQIVLQVGREVVGNALHPSVQAISTRLWDYVGLVDGLLFDMSGGEGKKLDMFWTREFLRIFRDDGLPFSFGVAGGLGPDSLEPIRDLLEEFPDLSWDAQGRLRNANNELDPEAVASYLDQSFALVQK